MMIIGEEVCSNDFSRFLARFRTKQRLKSLLRVEIFTQFFIPQSAIRNPKSKMNLDLHIEQLILHHIPSHQRHLVGAAIEQELTRLFTEQGVPPMLTQGGQIAELDGGAFHVAPHAPPTQIGSQVAQAIYGGFSWTDL